jgi:hypothetical protein
MTRITRAGEPPPIAGGILGWRKIPSTSVETTSKRRNQKTSKIGILDVDLRISTKISTPRVSSVAPRYIAGEETSNTPIDLGC